MLVRWILLPKLWTGHSTGVHADTGRHSPMVAPIARWSNTAGATQSGSKASSSALSMTARRFDGPMAVQDSRSWRKTDVILPRHDLRERDYQWRQRNADYGLCGQAIRSRPVPRRGADPPPAGLERALHRDDAPVRASRLHGDLRQPV